MLTMYRFRIRLAIVVIVFTLSAGLASFPGTVYAKPEPVSTNAYAAALIDVESGRILYSQRGEERTRIASLTKIMTAIVAIEQGDLSDIVKVGRNAAGKEGSSIYLKAGEEMSLQNMLYGLMLRSGNDAATAIAEHVGGSEQGFVLLMNEKAEWLGLDNTHFMNPHGLDHPDHYSSANDLAKLTAYALKNVVFQEIVKTKFKTTPNPNEEWDYSWLNKNKMLSMYEGADGVKTGYTKLASRCLVSSATRNGQQLAAVTLNDGDDWADHRKLLDWGFKHYPLQDMVRYGQKLSGYPFQVGRSFRYPLADGEKEQLATKLVLIDTASAAYALGERGGLEIYLGKEKIATLPVHELLVSSDNGQSGQDARDNRSAWAVNKREDSGSSFAESLWTVVQSLFA